MGCMSARACQAGGTRNFSCPRVRSATGLRDGLGLSPSLLHTWDWRWHWLSRPESMLQNPAPARAGDKPNNRYYATPLPAIPHLMRYLRQIFVQPVPVHPGKGMFSARPVVQVPDLACLEGGRWGIPMYSARLEDMRDASTASQMDARERKGEAGRLQGGVIRKVIGSKLFRARKHSLLPCLWSTPQLEYVQPQRRSGQPSPRIWMLGPGGHQTALYCSRSSGRTALGRHAQRVLELEGDLSDLRGDLG